MFGLDPLRLAQAIAFVGLFLLVSGPVHECAHAWTAWKLGDGTAKLFGRVTLNPAAHLDPVGALMLAFTALYGFGLGWAKPTPVNPYNLRGRYADTMVAAAGPLSNLALAVVFAVGFRLVVPPGTLQAGDFVIDQSPLGVLKLVLLVGVELNVALAIFNLIPVPPLDGSHVLYDFLSPQTARQIRPVLDQYGIFILILLLIPIGPNGSVVSMIFDRIGFPIIDFLIGA